MSEAAKNIDTIKFSLDGKEILAGADETILEAANARSSRALLSDFSALAKDNGTSLNAVLLGVIAASGVLPVSTESYEHAIQAQGIAVEPNLAGFRLGLEI